ncbi:MAG: DNA-binding response OmpR family regulator [Sulfurimonas sp.]|jgi:DNA-binding response OmpR family regulator|uniref:response regulator transcription factor n=1 Tax=Sulfurimonas sp. TaxID=2022749 RepID=UPI0039E5080B
MKSRVLKYLKVLLVEDEEKLASLLQNAIGDSFHSFSLAKDGEEGLEKFLKISPDIIITDIMMPNLTGLEMAREIRKIDSDIPIIVLSAFSESDKFLDAIDIGVVKYFIKPFDPEELLDYIQSVGEKLDSKSIELCDSFTFNQTTNNLYKNTRYVSLTKNEKMFLKLLLENAKDTIVGEDTIKISVWQNEEVSSERLRSFIKRLRSKTSKDLIINIKGQGYKISRL